MNNTLESNFINDYIVKDKKERLLHEFSNHKKRENALLRFSHNIESIVNNKFIQCKCNIDNWHQFINLTGNVYVISMLKIDGENCSIKDAIDILNEQYMPVIVISDNYVIIKSECDGSKNNIMILSKNIIR